MSASISNDNFSLPLAITRASQAGDAIAAMRLARDALEALEKQLAVFELEELFLSVPELESFSFSLEGQGDDEGGVSYYPIVCSERFRPLATEADAPQGEANDENDDDDDDELNEVVSGALYDIDDDILSSFEGISFERPPNGASLIEALMGTALSTDEFAQWLAQSQKEALDLSASAANSLRPAAISV